MNLLRLIRRQRDLAQDGARGNDVAAGKAAARKYWDAEVAADRARHGVLTVTHRP